MVAATGINSSSVENGTAPIMAKSMGHKLIQIRRFCPRCGTCRGFGNGAGKCLKQHGSPAGSRPLAKFGLLTFFFYRGFSRHKADFGVRPIAERFVRGCAAAAQRYRLFSADIDFVALGVSNFKLAQVTADHVWPGFLDQDVNCHLVSSKVSRSTI